MAVTQVKPSRWEALPSTATTPSGQTWLGFKLHTSGRLAEFRLVGSDVNKRAVKPYWAAWAFPFFADAAKASWSPLPERQIVKAGYRRLRRLCDPYCNEHRFAFRGEVYSGCIFGELLRYGKVQPDKLGDWRIITAAPASFLNGVTAPCLVLRDSNGSRFGVLAPMHKVLADGLPVLGAA